MIRMNFMLRKSLVVGIALLASTALWAAPETKKAAAQNNSKDVSAVTYDLTQDDFPLENTSPIMRKAGYWGIHLGGSFVGIEKQGKLYNTKVNNRTAIRLSFGYRFSPAYRMEFAVASLGSIKQIYTARYIPALNKTEAWSGKANFGTLMVNNYVHYPLYNERISPYLGLGLGVLRLIGEGKKENADDDSIYKLRSYAFAYQLMGGMDVAVMRNIVVGIDVRHTQGKLKLSSADANKLATKVSVTEVTLGGKFFF